MQSSILEDTQAFITKQREALLAQRETIFTLQADLQRQLDDLNRMLAKFDVFEGKRAAQTGTATRRSSGTRRGTKREGILTVLKGVPDGLTRGEILEKMGLKGDKAGEMSVSNALTAMTKVGQVRRDGGKYLA